MPPKVQARTYILLLKTHKLTVFLTASLTATINSLKADALTALQSDVLENKTAHEEHSMAVDDDPTWIVPKVTSVEDFELCRAVREKGRPTGQYEMLERNAQVKNVLVNWENVFVQFKDNSGQLLPVAVSLFSVLDEDEDEADAARKGKRKAPAESPQ
ncbi:hypothetical protein B0H21DRAFT_212351 [Amylocystis lapponica]|nr:hypothetical protein B0H21DRAFT_212351 [Amylocystis lapponica]